MRSYNALAGNIAGTSVGGAGVGIMVTKNAAADQLPNIGGSVDYVDVFDKIPKTSLPKTQPLRLLFGRVYWFKFENLYFLGFSNVLVDVTILEHDGEKIVGAPEAVLDRGSDFWTPNTNTAAGGAVWQRADIGLIGRREVTLYLDPKASGKAQIGNSAAPTSTWTMYPGDSLTLKISAAAEIWWLPNANGDLLYEIERG